MSAFLPSAQSFMPSTCARRYTTSVTNLPSKFTGLRVAEDAPQITPRSREQLHAPSPLRFARTQHKDPEKQAEIDRDRRARILGEAFARDEAINDPAIQQADPMKAQEPLEVAPR